MTFGRVAIAVRHASEGLAYAWRSQPNLRVEVGVGVAAVVATATLRAPYAPILLACGLVLSAELLNTALETVLDRLYPETDPIAGRAKDVSAAAVLVAALVAVLVGVVVLGPPAWALVAGGGGP